MGFNFTKVVVCFFLASPFVYSKFIEEVSKTSVLKPKRPVHQKKIDLPQKHSIPKTSRLGGQTGENFSGKERKRLPVNFSSDKITIYGKKNFAELEGKAHLWQDGLDIKAKKIILYQSLDSDSLDYAEAIGDVRIEGMEERSGDLVEIKAEFAIFWNKLRRLNLRGKVVATKRKSMILGDVMVYDLVRETLFIQKSKGQMQTEDSTKKLGG